MLPFLIPIVGAIKAIGGAWMETRKVKAEGKIAIATAKVAATVKKTEQSGEMDIQAMSGMQFSWKDELLTIWTLLILTACFIPGLQESVKDGFIFLDKDTPDWFGWCITGMYVSIFGLRTFKGWNK
jgi:hypothetical protein